MLWDEPKIFFLERRYFFSIILSEFLKNRVALHTVYSYRRDIYGKVGIQGENKLQQLRVRVSLMRREQTEYGGSPAPSNGENAGQAVNR